MPGTTSTDFFPAFSGVILVIIALVVVFIIVSVVLNVRRVRKAGHNPLTLQSDIATRLLDSDALSTQPSIEARLAKLEELRSAGTVTEEEYGVARSRLLAQL